MSNLINVFLLLLCCFPSGVFAHEDAKEIAVEREAERVQRLVERAQKSFEMRRSLPQSYMATSQDWAVELQVFPASGERPHTVRLMLLVPHTLDEVARVTLIQMASINKVQMHKRQGYFQAALRLPSQHITTLMIKLKTVGGQTYFFQFEH